MTGIKKRLGSLLGPQGPAGTEAANARFDEIERKSDNAVTRVEHIETVAGLAPGEVTDAQTANLVLQQDTATRVAMDAAFVSTTKTAINVLQAGASPDNTASQNTAILNDVLAQASQQGRAAYFPSVSPPLQIDDALTMVGPNLTVYGDGPSTVVEQTAWPRPFIDAGDYSGLTIQNLGVDNIAPRVSDMTSFRGNTLKNFSAFAYSNGSDVTVRNCRSRGFNAGVFNLGSPDARVANLTVENFEVRDTEFGVFCDYIDGVHLSNVWGDYSYSQGGTQLPHLIYVGAFANSAITDVTADNIRAFNSDSAQAFQFKGLIGGTITNLYADGCRGVLALDNITGTRFDGVTSLNDITRASNSQGSLNSVSLDPMTRVDIRNVSIHLVNDTSAIRFLNGDECRLENATVHVAHTSEQPGDQADIEVRGGWEVIRPRVVNTGTHAWNSIIARDGDGTVIRDPEVVGGRIPVRVYNNVKQAQIFYDPKRLGLHPTDGVSIMDAGNLAREILAVPSQSFDAILGSRNLAYANFDVASGSYANVGTINTGQAFIEARGIWQIRDGRVRTSDAGSGVAYVDVRQSDVEVSVDMTYVDANGLAFRALDADNYLFARLRSSGVELWKMVNNSQTQLGDRAAFSPMPHRRYRLAVQAFQDQVTVLVDGQPLLHHTLTAADQDVYGAATLHGLRAHTDTEATFTDFRIDSLR